jgi:methyl-accepting chemotaxis protein
MLRKMKLGTKLVAAFALLSLVSVAVGLYGIASLRRINAADRFLYEKMTTPIGDLVVMTRGFQRMRIGLRDAMDAATPQARATALEEARAQRDSVKKAAAEFGKDITTDNGRALFDAFSAAETRYSKAFDEILRLDGESRVAEVAAMMAGEGAAAAASEQAAIDALVAAKIDLAKSVAAGNTALGESTSTLMIVALAVAALLGLITALVLTRSVTRAVGGEPDAIADIADTVALGDLSVELGDASGASGIQKSLTGLVSSLRVKSADLKRIASGDLSFESDLASEADEVGISLRTMLSSLNDLLAQVAGSVDQLAAGSSQVSGAAVSLSQGAAEQAASIEEISASLTQINSQTKQNSGNALQVKALAKTSRERADKGNGQMKELVVAMDDINRSSDDIKKIIKTIDDIAFQINLLALNANVEAARAGKYGKGFAVVADEVRNLAVRSAEAVKETTRMVEASIGKVERGNALVRETAAQLAEITEGSARVAELSDEVAAASEEQSRGLEQINAGVEQIDQVTQSNTASAEESAAASEELASQAQQLKSMVARFSLRERSGDDGGSLRDLSPELIELIRKELATRGHREAPPTKRSIRPVVIAESSATIDEDFKEF